MKKVNLEKWMIRKIGSLQRRIKELETTQKRVLKELLTKKEVAAEFNLSERTIDRYRNNGLKYVQKSRNGKVLFKRKDLEKFFNEKQKL